MEPVRGETPVPRWLDAQRDSPAPRSGETPSPTETWQQHQRQRQRDNNARSHSFRRHTFQVQRQPGSLFRELRVFRVTLLNSET